MFIEIDLKEGSGKGCGEGVLDVGGGGVNGFFCERIRGYNKYFLEVVNLFCKLFRDLRVVREEDYVVWV